jgi:diguanylate cyclase (GGDEF)-like protein/PAS domain S-box-containing protein
MNYLLLIVIAAFQPGVDFGPMAWHLEYSYGQSLWLVCLLGVVILCTWFASRVLLDIHPKDELKPLVKTEFPSVKPSQFKTLLRFAQSHLSRATISNGEFAPDAPGSSFSENDQNIEELREANLPQPEDTQDNHSTNIYERYLNSTGEAFLIVSLPDYQILRANLAAQAMLGYSEEELKQLDFWEIFPGDEEFVTAEHWRELSSYGMPFRLETTWMDKEGSRFAVEISGSLLSSPQMESLVLIGRNIDEQKRSQAEEREHRQLAEALRDVAETLNSTLDIDTVLDRFLESLEKVISYSTANVMIVENGRTSIVRGKGYDSAQQQAWRAAWSVSVEEIPNLRIMAETGEPIYFSDTYQVDSWVHFEETSWIRSYLGAPILHDNLLLGFINLNSDQPGKYQAKQAAHIKAFAVQAAIALNNARLFAETRRRADRLALLNEIATAINMPGRLEDVLQSAADGLAKVLDVEQTGIALLKPGADQLIVVAEHTAPSVPSAVGEKIPIEGNPSMEYIVSNLKPLAIQDAQQDDRLSNIHNIMEERQVKSILIVPLIAHNRLIGTIGCDALGIQRAFKEEESSLAVTMAGLISARIEQANLLEAARRHASELEIVREILHLINSNPLVSQVLREISQHLKTLADCQRISLAIITETGDSYYLISTEAPVEGLSNGVPYAVVDSAATEDIFAGRQHITPDLEKETGYAAESYLVQSGFQSRINFPLVVGQTVIGSLNLVWEKKQGFTDINLTLIEQIADALALAVDRGQLLEETRRRDAILEILAYGAEKLMQLSTTDEIIPELLARLGDVTGASRAFVFENEIDPCGTLLLSQKYEWFSKEEYQVSLKDVRQKMPYQAQGLNRWVEVMGQDTPIYGSLPDFPEEEIEYLQSEKIQSIALVPIFVREKWWGYLEFDDCARGRSWSGLEIEALKNLADTLGGALARLQSEAAEKAHLTQTEALRDISAVMTATTNIQDVFQHILRNVGKVLNYDAANIMLLQSGILSIASSRGYLELGKTDPAKAFPRPVNEFKNFQRMADSGQSSVITNTLENPDWVPLSEIQWVQSNICAPIRYQEQTIGFINLDSGIPGFFRQEDAKRLMAFADQAAIAIENTRLFEETHQRALQMSLLNRMTQVAIGAQSIEEVLHSLSVQLVTLFNADTTYITLWDDDENRAIGLTSSHSNFRLERYPELIESISIFTQSAIEKGHVQIFEAPSEILSDLDARTRSLGSASTMVMPLISGGKKLGAAFISYNQKHVFSVDELALGEQAAGQIALAIAKANLLEAEVQKSNTLERVYTILTALSHVAVRLETAHDPEEVMKTLGEELDKLGITCFIWNLNPESRSLQFRYTSLKPIWIRDISKVIAQPLNSLELDQDEFGHYQNVIVERRAVFIENLDDLLSGVGDNFSTAIAQLLNKRSHEIEKVSGFFLPLMAEEKVIGTIWMLANDLSRHDQAAATIFAGQVAMALENARLYQSIQQLAITDELTGIYNRRGLMELGRREFDRARRFSRSLFALMFDLDDFRNVNNSYGHPVGDEVLQEVAVRCRSVLRSTDVLGRYGGEEFTVLLPETDIAGAREIAERLRYLVSSRKIHTSKAKISITISVGVAALATNCEDLVMLLEWADQGLYMAKRSGKNRVSMAIPDSPDS